VQFFACFEVLRRSSCLDGAMCAKIWSLGLEVTNFFVLCIRSSMSFFVLGIGTLLNQSLMSHSSIFKDLFWDSS